MKRKKTDKQYEEWEGYEVGISGVGSCWGDMRGKPKTKRQIGFIRSQKVPVRTQIKKCPNGKLK